jgi:DNA-binding transcriptional ArsR family regulator
MLPEQTRGLFDAHRSIHTSVLTESAALVADTSRATMLTTLLDGRAYTAKELACAALVSAATASFHLRKLCQSGLILGVSQGRHRFFRLASDEVARILEGLLSLQPPLRVNAVTNRCPPHLRQARCCYNHIAGRLGVGIYRVFLRSAWIAPGKHGWQSTARAGTLLDVLSIPALPTRPCLDWSEREYHLAGELGNRLLQAMLERRWLLRGDGRALTLTANGKRQLAIWGI